MKKDRFKGITFTDVTSDIKPFHILQEVSMNGILRECPVEQNSRSLLFLNIFKRKKL